jgi:hypothetical protein
VIWLLLCGFFWWMLYEITVFLKHRKTSR